MDIRWQGEPGFPSPEAWNEFVSTCPHGHLLQSWQWGEFKGRFGWRPMRAVVLSEDGRIRAAGQLLLRRLPYRSLAYVPRGPACEPADGDALRLLLDALHNAARRQGAIALKVEPPWPDGAAAAAWWTGRGFRPSPQTIQPRRTIIVDLLPDEEAILAQMKPKWRYNIRLAARKEVTVRHGSAEDLPTFYSLMQETSRRDGFAIHVPAYYEAGYRLFAPDRVALLIAEYRGEPLAALMAFSCGRQAVYMWGASSDRERPRMPNHLLQWEAMRWARERGCAEYDLWGIPDVEPGSPSAGLAGVERFKAGFGGRDTRYVGAFDYVYSPLVYWAFTRLWARRRAAARRAQAREEGAAEEPGEAAPA